MPCSVSNTQSVPLLDSSHVQFSQPAPKLPSPNNFTKPCRDALVLMPRSHDHRVLSSTRALPKPHQTTKKPPCREPKPVRLPQPPPSLVSAAAAMPRK
ncbi:hypothetical protein M0R45_002513 [Rubus argutus]|uniref:Uncharacterized protein n=1 Tax=Rubus argutus TaxID=59490 RepID=A0AAW1VRV6_RUBAR